MVAAKKVKVEGQKNDLIERIAADPAFNLNIDELRAVLEPKNYVGRSPSQVEEFINDVVKPVLEQNKDIEVNVELKV